MTLEQLFEKHPEIKFAAGTHVVIDGSPYGEGVNCRYQLTDADLARLILLARTAINLITTMAKAQKLMGPF